MVACRREGDALPPPRSTPIFGPPDTFENEVEVWRSIRTPMNLYLINPWVTYLQKVGFETYALDEPWDWTVKYQIEYVLTVLPVDGSDQIEGIRTVRCYVPSTKHPELREKALDQARATLAFIKIASSGLWL